MDVGAFAKSDKRAMPTAETSLDEVYTPFTDETCSPSCVGHRDGPCSFVAFLQHRRMPATKRRQTCGHLLNNAIACGLAEISHPPG